MPSRWLSLAIVALWLSTTGWLFWRDILPQWRSGEPPPYTIDLIEEVNTDPRYKPHSRWNVFQNEDQVFRAETWVDHPQPEVFELKALLKPVTAEARTEGAVVGPLRVLRMESAYRVTQEGNLLGIEGKVEAKVGPELEHLLKGLSADVTVTVTGEVRQGQFLSTLRFASAILPREFKFDLPPVPASGHGSVLLPLHPVNRIQGLRPGQEWRMPVVNPLADALAASQGLSTSNTRFLQARVLPESQLFTARTRLEAAPSRSDVPCLVIEYWDDEMTAHTWVEVGSGLVLRQEARRGGEHWVMDRE